MRGAGGTDRGSPLGAARFNPSAALSHPPGGARGLCMVQRLFTRPRPLSAHITYLLLWDQHQLLCRRQVFHRSPLIDFTAFPPRLGIRKAPRP
ncbi:hypothetical protein EYF80_033031 [Liparis tanakae]|uniref:Uncharacterized protein n=1 Tax=Liparis tanakae TaxID=230148 RepID=A0A4Z2GVJ6_9TELE|nr:hypothetical protein EYF80_033031 [Liparis tanakae]